MTERDLRKNGTLELVREFLETSKAFEDINYASFLRNPYWWVLKKTKIFDRRLRGKRAAELSEKNIALAKELSKRYEGILYQLFTWTGTQHGFDNYLTNILYKIQALASTIPDYRYFSTTLWDVHLKYGNEISKLKPKFMLWQFVDEMTEGEPYMALYLLAYMKKVDLSAITRGAAESILQAYPLLHEQAWNFMDDLSIMTGDVLITEEVRKFKPPYREYHDWLFPEP